MSDESRRCPRCDCPDGAEQCKVCPHVAPLSAACAVLHTDAEGNVIPCPDYPHQDAEQISDQLAALLPPFSGDNATCAKCGYGRADAAYRAQGEPRPNTFEAQLRELIGVHGNAPERLERRCLRCGHIWDEALAQQEAP